ncbi:MAG: enoyl-CoA hydratase/isomerase family protein [Calditrichaeota bacterium]|nr:enoyl-CoA hydratase/isomerase family protein [Calditrichota bacterium]MCB9366244.1 enoyl-CoA hydratase/isomerase family protein [Calditrichota bacterium]MCB9391687.1 enoyl-CoA hydratase/isomerase family protein [Calditrichota bacterium]
MSYENILWETDGSVGILTINRPKALNSLNRATLDDIESCLNNDLTGDIRALVITGAGEKSFVAGADIAEIHELDSKTGLTFTERGNSLFARIEALPIPVIAAVGGFALGGGCELAMACHLRVASEKAKFGQPEIKLGIIPGYGGTQRLSRLVGTGRALDLLLSGRMIDAATALQWGLANEAVAPEQTLARAKELATQLAACAPVARKAILEAVYQGAGRPLADGLRVEENLFAHCCGTADKNEGTAAFLEKRDAVFTGK